MARGEPDAVARLAAEMGVLAFHRGFVEWSSRPHDDGSELARLTVAALHELRKAAALLA